MLEVKYPNVKVKLVGEDGNAFAILGRVSKALRRAGVPGDEVSAFFAEATQGDYDSLLRTCMAWVDVSGDLYNDEEDDASCECCHSTVPCDCDPDYEEDDQ